MHEETIDKNSPLPIYYQLKTLILNNIINGVWKPGDIIPTEKELIEKYEVSRTTVRQAITELVYAGYLVRAKGKGTFVQKPKVEQDFMRKLEPFYGQMKKANVMPSTKVIAQKPVQATDEVAEFLNIPEKSSVVYLRRLRFADGEPIVLVDTYLPLSCSFVFDVDLEQKSLYETLSSIEETRVVKAVRKFEATVANRNLSTLLKIKSGHPVQLVKTIGYNSAGVPVEYSVANYIGDKNTFIVEVNL